MRSLLLTLLPFAALAACGDRAGLDVSAGQGQRPALPAERHSLIPTVKIPKLVGWKPGETPTPAPGLQVRAFAAGLDHPRWLTVLPNGDVLVAESSAPPRPDDEQGIKGFFQRFYMTRAGGMSKSANRVTLLRDTDGDGVADARTVLLSGLNSPFGLQYRDGTLYVAATDAVLAWPFRPGQTRITGAPRTVVALPAGRINHHWTKNILISPDGARLYATVGSNSNIDDRGIAAEAGRAAIWEVDLKTGAHRVFASGLRNPNGMAWMPDGSLWTVVNERDELGGDLVPDYLTSVKPGGFYGWPWRYYGTHVDKRVEDPAPPQAARSIVPDYALGAHTAALGLAAGTGETLGPAWAEGVFVGQHGSWNRDPPSGYRVIFVPFEGSRPTGAKPVDVLTGFLSADGRQARGRPVGVAIDGRGALLVADDAGNTIWRVTPAARLATR